MKNYLSFHSMRSITKQDITIFLRQLSTFITAGVSLTASLSFLSSNQLNQPLAKLIKNIHQDIQTGKTFASTLKLYPKYFSTLACHLIQLGEETGTFDTILLTLTTYQEKSMSLHRRIKQAMFYPAIIIFLSLLITCSLLYFVVPHFAILFVDAKDRLPPITAAIFHLSNFMHESFWLIILSLLILLACLAFFFESCTHLWNTLIERSKQWPIIAYFHAQITIARFSRHLALTYRSGISILEALSLAANASGNQQLMQLISKIIKEARGGIPLSKSMSTISIFPPLFIQFIKIGEESGKLDLMLEKYADIADANIDTLLQRANVLLEPLIMLILGVLIGGLVIGMYLPLFKLGSVL